MNSRLSYKKTACILSVCLILLLLLSIGMILNRTTSNEAMVAEVYLDGELVERIDLSQVTHEYEFTLMDASGGYNTITVKPGSIGITKSDCPNQICVHQGFMKDELLPIVCLPHHLVIRLVPRDSENLTDAVTY